jgi:hypothetical protein
MRVLYTVKIHYVPHPDAWYHEVAIDDNAPLLMSPDYANIHYAEMIKDYIYERNLQDQYSLFAQAVDLVRIGTTTIIVMQHRTTSHVIADHEARQLLKRAVTH